MQKIVTKRNILLALKITLPILYVLTLIFIFSQSLQTGQVSAQTSSKVVETVQEAVKIIAPQSPIATAEGEALDELHSTIRTLAHFAEFALLGALASGCCLVFTWENFTQHKKYLFIGAASLILMPLADEFIQSFTANRAADWIDVVVDFAGGSVGFGLVLGCVFGILYLMKKHNHKERREKA